MEVLIWDSVVTVCLNEVVVVKSLINSQNILVLIFNVVLSV